MLSRWVIRVGVFSLVLGVLLLSPIADLLPLDLWASISSSLNSQEKHAYVRVVAAEQSYTVQAILVLLGLALMLLGHLLRRER